MSISNDTKVFAYTYYEFYDELNYKPIRARVIRYGITSVVGRAFAKHDITVYKNIGDLGISYWFHKPYKLSHVKMLILIGG